MPAFELTDAEVFEALRRPYEEARADLECTEIIDDPTSEAAMEAQRALARLEAHPLYAAHKQAVEKELADFEANPPEQIATLACALDTQAPDLLQWFGRELYMRHEPQKHIDFVTISIDTEGGKASVEVIAYALAKAAEEIRRTGLVVAEAQLENRPERVAQLRILPDGEKSVSTRHIDPV